MDLLKDTVFENLSREQLIIVVKELIWHNMNGISSLLYGLDLGSEGGYKHKKIEDSTQSIGGEDKTYICLNSFHSKKIQIIS